jgi:hypothetical protein
LEKRLIKGDILHFLSNPNLENKGQSYQYFENGFPFIEDGLVTAVGTEQDVYK